MYKGVFIEYGIFLIAGPMSQLRQCLQRLQISIRQHSMHLMCGWVCDDK